jgi:hypothetical protein
MGCVCVVDVMVAGFSGGRGLELESGVVVVEGEEETGRGRRERKIKKGHYER